MRLKASITAKSKSHSANPVQQAEETRQLTPRQEKFCHAYIENDGDANAAWKASHDVTGMTRAAIRVAGYRMRWNPAVAARLREINDAIAECTVVSVARQLVDLADMAAVDLTDLWRLESHACPACHKLYDADLLAGRVLPDLSQPLPPHPCCANALAHQSTVMLAMDQWPAAARRLYDGVEVARDGTLRPVFRDRSQIQDQVNKMLGAYVVKTESKSLNVNYSLNAPMTTQAPISAEDALAKLRALGVLTDPDAVVSEQ